MIDFEEIHRIIKDTLSDDAYQEWQKAIQKYENNKRHCLIDAFFRHQDTLPPAQRKDYCHLHCPCPNCSPGML